MKQKDRVANKQEDEDSQAQRSYNTNSSQILKRKWPLKKDNPVETKKTDRDSWLLGSSSITYADKIK